MTNATYESSKGEYLRAKRRFRSFGQKSSRFTRFPRKSWSLSMSSRKGGKRKGRKGKSRGKGRYHFEPSVINHSSLAGGKGGKRKGKGKGKEKSGSNMSYVTNPRGSDGQIMKRHACLSTDHLVASCPKKNGGKRERQAFHD